MIHAVLSFDVDAESPVLADSARHARDLGAMSHQAYGPREGVLRILALLAEYSLPATFFVPGWTADRWPQAVEQILAAGHEVGHHSYAHVSPVDQRYETACSPPVVVLMNAPRLALPPAQNVVGPNAVILALVLV